MSKLLKILGVVFLLLIAGFVVLLMWSHKKGEATQAAFYQAVVSGDAQQVMDKFHPEMLDLVDRAPLQVWMNAVKENLGEFKDLSGSNFSTSKHSDAGRDVVLSEGTVVFEKGEGRSVLHEVDGKIVKFELTAEKLPNPWLTQSPDPASYVEVATTFMRHLVEDRIPQARALMHEALRREITEEDLTTGMTELQKHVGDAPTVQAEAPQFEADPPSLRIPFTVKGSSGTAQGHVSFQFSPWKGHMVAFRLRPAGS